jgi:hypothetical protein
MGLSGDERGFLQRLLDMPDGAGFVVGTRFYPQVHFSTVVAEGEKTIQSLIRRGYCSSSHDPLMAKLTEAGAEAMRAEKKASEAFSKGMEGGKKMFGNAVNRLRAKLSDKRIPTIANRLHKLFSKRTDLTEEEKALLTEIKEALGAKSELPPQGPFQITVNGKLYGGVPRNVLSYTEIIELAGFRPEWRNVSAVVSMRSKDQGQKAFMLHYGETVFLEPGWNVDVTATITSNA